jgi:hypothetical protein
MLFKYQYQTLGRISEVAGKYMPTWEDHRIIEVSGEKFALFIVKTAKRKGRLRPCARPLNKKYDPWTKEVVDYISSRGEYPFMLHENVETSKTYAMEAARQMFEGLYWPMIDYTRTSERSYTKDMIIHTDFGKNGYERYLVEFPDKMRSWTSDAEIVKFSVKIDPRWKPATSHVIRKRATLTLANDYLFDGFDLGYIGGWTLSGQQEGVPQALKHYMFMDLKESKVAIPQLEKQARRYAQKLLIPYSNFI